ncbi:hypothetical protein ACHAWF_005582 [Thalassiosira exigua]
MDNVFGAAGDDGVGGGPVQWFRSLPPVSRALLASTLMVTALVNLEFVKWHYLDFHGWEDVIGRGSSGRVEAWRLVPSFIESPSLLGVTTHFFQWNRLLTCFLYVGKFGWSAIIGLHLMTQISARYETMGPISTRRIHQAAERPGARNYSPYHSRGESSDYAFALLLGMAGILLSNAFLLPKLPHSITHNRFHRFFHRHLTHFIVYIWSKQHPHHRVNFFGVALSAAYLPWAYVLIGYALNNQMIPVDILHGMFVGHLYFYFASVVPQVLGRGAVLSTPIILVDFCNWLEERGRVGNVRGGINGPMLVDVDGVIGG